MAENLVGKWKMVKVDNMEDYMKDAKFGFMLKQILRKLTITIEIIKNSEEEWQLNYLTSVKDVKQTFRVNEQFKKTTSIGTNVMALYRFEGDKLIYEEESLKKGDVPVRCVLQVTEDGQLHEQVWMKIVARKLSTFPNDSQMKCFEMCLGSILITYLVLDLLHFVGYHQRLRSTQSGLMSVRRIEGA